ncbi:MAG TPA: hypothetical protein VK886_21845 [Vicinamibacterales bacterium]|nr:hypothetical protein [Vicinamibacterales bacterium]
MTTVLLLLLMSAGRVQAAPDDQLRAGRLVEPPADRPYRGVGIAGGAPGTSSVLPSSGSWTIVVLTNLDPPTGEQIGSAIARRLSGKGTQE